MATLEKTPTIRDPSRRDTGQALSLGAGFGLVAGFIFAVVEIIASVAMGGPALMPVRMFASVVLGQGALTGALSLGWVIVVGLVVHFALSALFGLIYGALESRMGVEGRTSWGRQSALGLLFGAAVWLVNFQIIARLIYPWFLAAPQFLQLMLHAVAFGLPLGLMFAAFERQRRRAELSAGNRVVA